VELVAVPAAPEPVGFSPVASSTVTADSTVSIVASPQPEAEKSTEAPSEPPVDSTELAEKVETVQPRPENQGFFKRIFGRFRQH
jgi:hypothetical protein